MNALGDKADEQEQDVLFPAAQTFVAVRVLTIVEADVELSQFIPDSSDEAAGDANPSLPFLNQSELFCNLASRRNGRHEGLQRHLDVDDARVGGPPPSVQ